MPRGWPPLARREIVSILTELGLVYSYSKGGHDFYTGTRNGVACKVTVSQNQDTFTSYLISSMCSQANSNRKEFYGATKSTAKKIR